MKVYSWGRVFDLLIDLVIAVVAEAIMAFPVMWAWNCVIPVVTKLPELDYWQVFSLMFLVIIVKNTFRK